MNRLSQFAGLPAQERRLLLRAAGLVAAVRLALWFLPFALVRRAAGMPRVKAADHALARIRARRILIVQGWPTTSLAPQSCQVTRSRSVVGIGPLTVDGAQ